jgi:hypothetical protein
MEHYVGELHPFFETEASLFPELVDSAIGYPLVQQIMRYLEYQVSTKKFRSSSSSSPSSEESGSPVQFMGKEEGQTTNRFVVSLVCIF